MKLVLESKDVAPEAPVLDWWDTPLAHVYDGAYAKIIDDVFTPEECDALIALAESDKEWSPAMINFGLGPDQKFFDTTYRNSERILRFDDDAAEQIFKRLLPYIPELVELRPGDPWAGVIQMPAERLPPMKGTWKLVGLNERLSYLRYGPGQYFREHVDSWLDLPDGRKSRVTIQIYLGQDGVEGGATRIRDITGQQYIDVEPKKGRVLVFQQRPIWHSGEDVVKGLKFTLRSDLMYVGTTE